MDTISHILVTTDFSKASELALTSARMLAQKFGAKVTLLHVYDAAERLPPATVPLSATQRRNLEREIREELTARLATLCASKMADVRIAHAVILPARNAAEAICDYAAQHRVGIIVIATRGRGAVPRWLIGSVAERVVRHAPCPVWVVRSRAKR